MKVVPNIRKPGTWEFRDVERIEPDPNPNRNSNSQEQRRMKTPSDERL